MTDGHCVPLIRGVIAMVFVLTAAACSSGTSPDTDGASSDVPPSVVSTNATGSVAQSGGGETNEASVSDWTRSPHVESVFGGPNNQAMWDVATGGPGLVAVGEDSSGGDWDAAVWTSIDGAVWTKIPQNESVLGGADEQLMIAVTAGGPGLVAVGYDASGGDWDAAVWTSVDGVVWVRIPHDESVFGGPDYQSVRGVVARGSGLVAVGDDFSGGDLDAAVWISTDGVVWARVPHDEAVFGGPDGQAMIDVISGGPGFVAVGRDSSGRGWDAAVWTSPDGLVWTRVANDESVFGGLDDQTMFSVAARGDVLVAVGNDYREGDADAAVWTSPDGLVWTRVANDESVFGGSGNQTMFAVVAGVTGFTALGSDNSGGDSDAAVWTSNDGLVWVRVSDRGSALGGGDDQEIIGAVSGRLGIVAVGDTDSGGDWDAAVWMVGPPG